MALTANLKGLPEQFFKVMCQNPKCRIWLGGFHIPAVGGTAVYVCSRCGTVSVFRNGAYEIKPAIAGVIDPAKLK